MYHHALDELEISGASGQEMVWHMQRVALFLQKAGETEAAQQIMVCISLTVRVSCMHVTALSIARLGGCNRAGGDSPGRPSGEHG